MGRSLVNTGQDYNVAVRGILCNLVRGGPSAVSEIQIRQKTVHHTRYVLTKTLLYREILII